MTPPTKRADEPSGGLLAVATALLLAACQGRTPALERALEGHPELGPGIYQPLARWEAALGEPQTVAQADGGETLFYWPEHGLAVFTHPHYEGQYLRKEPGDRRVTSVILPLRESFVPQFLPVEEGQVIRFTRVFDLEELVAEATLANRHKPRDEEAFVDPVSSPLGKTTERLHLAAGEPVALEIRDTWWLSHYD